MSDTSISSIWIVCNQKSSSNEERLIKNKLVNHYSFILLWLKSLYVFIKFSKYIFFSSSDSDHLYEVMVDIFLVLLFITQHSVMASMWFKQWVLDRGLIVVERAVYVICTCLTLRVSASYHSSMVWMALAELTFINMSCSCPHWHNCRKVSGWTVF